MSSIAGSRWVITGAAGNIGSALRSALLERHAVLVSTDIRPITSSAPHESVAEVDLADVENLVELFAGADGVVHLGGIADEADFHDLAEANILGTYHVLEAARRAGVRRVVYASSNRLTGSYTAGDHVTPDMPPRPDGFYGVSKAAGEALCRGLYADKFGMSTITLRIGSYEEQPSSAREQRTWLSPSDAIRAFVAAMTTTEHTRSVLRRLREHRWLVGPPVRGSRRFLPAGRRGRMEHAGAHRPGRAARWKVRHPRVLDRPDAPVGDRRPACSRGHARARRPPDEPSPPPARRVQSPA